MVGHQPQRLSAEHTTDRLGSPARRRAKSRQRARLSDVVSTWPAARGGGRGLSMRIHVVAVSGTGMGPLAGLLVSMGHEVTGSDVAFDPPIGPKLLEWGVRCVPGFDAKNLAYGPDLVVIGNSCRSNNPEARFAIDNG